MTRRDARSCFDLQIQQRAAADDKEKRAAELLRQVQGSWQRELERLRAEAQAPPTLDATETGLNGAPAVPDNQSRSTTTRERTASMGARAGRPASDDDHGEEADQTTSISTQQWTHQRSASAADTPSTGAPSTGAAFGSARVGDPRHPTHHHHHHDQRPPTAAVAEAMVASVESLNLRRKKPVAKVAGWFDDGAVSPKGRYEVVRMSSRRTGNDGRESFTSPCTAIARGDWDVTTVRWRCVAGGDWICWCVCRLDRLEEPATEGAVDDVVVTRHRYLTSPNTRRMR